MSVIPATFVRYRHGRYSRNALERDLDAIRNLYRANGFRDVEVTSRVLDDYNGDNGSHRHLHRNRRRAAVVRFQARPSKAFPTIFAAALMLFLHSTDGQPYSDLNIATDRDNVLDYYFNNGYPAAKFDFTSVPAAEANHVDLTFIVTPGERVYVRNVVVDGSEAHAARSGDGPHQPARGRSALAEPDQRKPAAALRSRHFFARRCRHPKSRRRRARPSTCSIRSKKPDAIR